MIDYSIFHTERYGHGKPESNELPDDKKVIIADHDGYYDVYECDSDDEAQAIANWYISAAYESYPHDAHLEKQHNRYFSVEVA